MLRPAAAAAGATAPLTSAAAAGAGGPVQGTSCVRACARQSRAPRRPCTCHAPRMRSNTLLRLAAGASSSGLACPRRSKTLPLPTQPDVSLSVCIMRLQTRVTRHPPGRGCSIWLRRPCILSRLPLHLPGPCIGLRLLPASALKYAINAPWLRLTCLRRGRRQAGGQRAARRCHLQFGAPLSPEQRAACAPGRVGYRPCRAPACCMAIKLSRSAQAYQACTALHQPQSSKPTCLLRARRRSPPRGCGLGAPVRHPLPARARALALALAPLPAQLSRARGPWHGSVGKVNLFAHWRALLTAITNLGFAPVAIAAALAIARACAVGVCIAALANIGAPPLLLLHALVCLPLPWPW